MPPIGIPAYPGNILGCQVIAIVYVLYFGYVRVSRVL